MSKAFGCHGPAKKPLSKQRAFAALPDGPAMDRCPMHYLVQSADGWRDSIAGLLHDVEAGLVHDWPEGYTAGTVQAIRYIRRESASCGAEIANGT